MATTVGVPCALAARMILGGEIQQKGVLRPIAKEVYGPLLKALEGEGIAFVERVEAL
jgi:saccharopine dehydrogenase-like NADP-dependent oxidoreductase